MILRLKKKNLPPQKRYFFKKNVDIEKVLVSSKISSDEKNYKYFIGDMYNNDKVNLLHIMFRKKTLM